MDADRSHGTQGIAPAENWRSSGRPRRSGVKWIALPAVAALAAGFHLGVTGFREAARPGESARVKELSAENRLAVESFWASLDSVRWQAVALAQIRDAESAAGRALEQLSLPTGKIIH